MAKPDALLYVSKDIEVFTGQEAERRLAENSDARYLDAQKGVVQVDSRRWEEAQQFEKKSWMERGLDLFEDRNDEHLLRFQRYASLTGRTFLRSIELGCGPFTNTRLLLEHVRVNEVHLLDPLVRSYVDHPYCRYRNSRLGGLPALAKATTLRQLRHNLSRPSAIVREVENCLRIGGLAGRSVCLESSSIEDFHTDLTFDLVIMINVLEHCRDAVEIINQIDRLLVPGGVFIFHDRLWDSDELQRTIGSIYDAGHPLRVGHDFFCDFLSQQFEPLLRDESSIVEEECGVSFRRTSLYFIGRKHSLPGTQP
jgi:SAM-dependent methyltransferase